MSTKYQYQIQNSKFKFKNYSLVKETCIHLLYFYSNKNNYFLGYNQILQIKKEQIRGERVKCTKYRLLIARKNNNLERTLFGMLLCSLNLPQINNSPNSSPVPFRIFGAMQPSDTPFHSVVRLQILFLHVTRLAKNS